jgi:RHS repeat-associated protein
MNKEIRVLLTLAVLVFASTVCASIPKTGKDFSTPWDAENRLIAVSSNGTSIASYQYDSENRRVSKTVGDTTHQYTYDGWNLIAETITSSQSYSLNLYIWGPDINGSLSADSGGVRGLLCILSSDNGQQPTAYYPVMNNHGDVTALFDASGTQIVAKYERDPFGVLLSATGPAANVCPFGFQTKYYDAETGLYYICHRYYSPTLGRWMSRDPIAEQGGFNLYSYGNGNPFEVDGLGLDPEHNTSANEATASISLDALFPPPPTIPVQTEIRATTPWEQTHPNHSFEPQSLMPERAENLKYNGLNFFYNMMEYGSQAVHYKSKGEMGRANLCIGLMLVEDFPLSFAVGGPETKAGAEIIAAAVENTAVKSLKIPATDVALAGTRILGYTKPNGSVYLRPGLSRVEQLSTLKHESVHAFFSPRGSGPVTNFRQRLGQWGYDNSQLLRFTEEAIAETHGSGSLLQGLRHPLVNGYGINAGGLLLEGGAVGVGIGGAVYFGNQIEGDK